MRTRRHLLAAGGLLVGLCLFSSGHGTSAGEMVAFARKLADFYDHLDVENRWIAGVHVDWRTGEPDGRPERMPGQHTHCSAFVAAAAERLGIYILRPPEHGQVLLANAQNEWLAGPGQDHGWLPLDDAAAAENAANSGFFVVASYHNHEDNRPGHIAIVRPSSKSAAAVAADGPDIIQAGAQNFTRITLREGFAGHPHAWNDAEVAYFAHSVPAGRLQ